MKSRGVIQTMSGLKNFDDNLIQISSLQTYNFCPRRYYLLNIECNDINYGNELTVKGSIEHSNVHKDKIEKRGNFVKITDMQVNSQKLGIIGKCDVVEFYKNETGTYIPFLDGNFDIIVIEHKRSELKTDDSDLLQLTAQVLCIEEMFNTNISSSYIYYKLNNKRKEYEISKSIREKVKQKINEIRDAEKLTSSPQPVYKRYCKNCAAYEICQPKKYNINKYIEGLWKSL